MTHLVDAPAGHQVSGQEQLDGTSWTVRVGKVAGTTPMGAAAARVIVGDTQLLPMAPFS